MIRKFFLWVLLVSVLTTSAFAFTNSTATACTGTSCSLSNPANAFDRNDATFAQMTSSATGSSTYTLDVFFSRLVNLDAVSAYYLQKTSVTGSYVALYCTFSVFNATNQTAPHFRLDSGTPTANANAFFNWTIQNQTLFNQIAGLRIYCINDPASGASFATNQIYSVNWTEVSAPSYTHVGNFSFITPNATTQVRNNITASWSNTTGTDFWFGNLLLVDASNVSQQLLSANLSQSTSQFVTFGSNITSGQYRMNLYAYDSGGNFSYNTSELFTIDRTPPSCTFTNQSFTLENVNVTPYSWTCTDAHTSVASSSVQCSNGQSSSAINGSLTFNATNSTTCAVSVLDTVGNEYSAQWSMTYLPLSFTFISQNPPDLNGTNFIFGANITYNITQYGNRTPYLSHTFNQSNVVVNKYINGTAVVGFLNESFVTNTSDQFLFFIDEVDILPAVYTIDPYVMESRTPAQSFSYTLPTEQTFYFMEFFNVSNVTDFNRLELMTNNSQTSGGITPTAVWYCNEQYLFTTTVTTSPYCTQIGSVTNPNDPQHQHGTASFHHSVAFPLVNGTVNGIPVTARSYIGVRGKSGVNDAVVYGLNQPVRPQGAWLTTNNGVLWSNPTQSLDMHLHQLNTTGTLVYKPCADGICGDERVDAITGLYAPPSSPIVTYPIGTIVVDETNRTFTANWTPSVPQFPATIVGYNVTVWNASDGVVLYVNVTTQTTQPFSLNGYPLGSYYVLVCAIDSFNDVACSDPAGQTFTLVEYVAPPSPFAFTSPTTNSTNGVIQFAWTPSGNASWYENLTLFYGNGTLVSILVANTTNTAYEYYAQDQLPNGSYYAEVTAVNFAGTYTAQSQTIGYSYVQMQSSWGFSTCPANTDLPSALLFGGVFVGLAFIGWQMGKQRGVPERAFGAVCGIGIIIMGMALAVCWAWLVYVTTFGGIVLILRNMLGRVR